MSRWKKLLGPCAASRAGEPTWPVEIEDVTGKLSARVSAAGTAMAFALTWRDQEYVSPVDGRSYIAEGGWDTDQPTTPPGAPTISRVTTRRCSC